MEQFEFDARIASMERWWKTVTQELVTIIFERPSVVIYHYTDINGLLGMVGTGKIWATHVSRLNDKSEYDHGIKVVADCVRNAMPSTSRPLVDKILSEFRRIETFVASYSTKSDLLSQWRSYSGGSVGYCLGLGTDGIATLDESTPLLEAVIYGDSKTQQIISKMVRRVEEYLGANKFGNVEVGYLLGMIGGTLANLACTIKHPKFGEESEYR